MTLGYDSQEAVNPGLVSDIYYLINSTCARTRDLLGTRIPVAQQVDGQVTWRYSPIMDVQGLDWVSSSRGCSLRSRAEAHGESTTLIE